MPNMIGTACDLNHILHPIAMPKKERPPGPLRRIAGAALLILSIPFTLGILTGLYLYWAHKKVVQVKKEETQAIDQTVQKLFGQKVGAQPKNSPFVQTAQSLRMGNTEKAFEQMKDLKTRDQLTEEASHALLEAAIEQNKTGLVHDILTEFKGIKIPLHKAKTAEMVRQLISEGAEPKDRIDDDWNTPLHFAANLEVAKALVAGGATVERNNKNYTPLHTCIDPEVAAYLVASEPEGLGIDKNDTYNGIPAPIFTVPVNVKIALIRDLKADPMIPTPYDRENLLHKCEDPELAQLLLEKGVGIDITDSKGSPPLFTIQSPEVLKLLIDKGADVRAINNRGDTIIHHRSLPESLLNLILEKAGEPSLLTVLNDEGQSPLFTNPSDKMKILLIKKEGDPKALDDRNNTTLHFCKTKELAEILIKSGVDVNSKNDEGKTPLHLADNVEMATFLLKNGAQINALDDNNSPPGFLTKDPETWQFLINRPDVDLTIKDSNGRGALHYAAMKGDIESARLLLEKKLSPDDVDAEGNTPLNLLIKNTNIVNDNQLIKLLAQVTNLKVVNKEQQTALHFLLPRYPHADLIQFFLDHGAEPKVLDKEGNTLLFYSSYREEGEVLVKAGVVPTQVNNAGQTALFFAYSDGLARYLVEECKVDATIKDNQGRTPLHTCKSDWAIEWMIQEKKLDPNSTDNQQQTPLHSHSCNRLLVETLINLGANVNATDNKGQTALHLCHRDWWSSESIVEFLIEKGAHIDARDNDGRTPLHFCKDVKAAEILIEKGANIDAQDNEGRTPLHFCKDVEVAEILIREGAKSLTDKNGQLPEILDELEE